MWWIALIVLAFLLPELISTVLDSRLGRAVAARLEAGGTEGEGAVNERIRYLEGEVDRLSDDVRRLRDESDFLQRLLSERSAGDPSRSRRSSDSRLPRGDAGE